MLTSIAGDISIQAQPITGATNGTAVPLGTGGTPDDGINVHFTFEVGVGTVAVCKVQTSPDGTTWYDNTIYDGPAITAYPTEVNLHFFTSNAYWRAVVTPGTSATVDARVAGSILG